MRSKGIRRLISTSFKDWLEDEAFRLSAAIAFYAIFSLAPALVIVVAVVDSIYSGNTEAEIYEYISQYMGPEAASLITRAVVLTGSSTPSSLLPAILGISTTLMAATAAFAELQRAMNRIWEIELVSNGILSDVLQFVRNRILGFLMVLLIAALMLTSMLLSAGLSVYGRYLEAYVPGAEYAWPYVEMAISFVVLVVLFAAIFKFLPDAVIAWRDVWIGAFITACLFTLGKLGIAYYISSSGNSVYGAAGGVLVVLAWIYYSTLILFLGAEFTQSYAEAYGHSVLPKHYAVHRPRTAYPGGATGPQRRGA